MRDQRGQRAKTRKIDRRFFRGMVFGRARDDYARRMRRRYWRVATLLALGSFIWFIVPSMLLLILMSSPLYHFVLLLPIDVIVMSRVMALVVVSGQIGGMVLGFGIFLTGYFLFLRRVMADMIAANGYCGSCSYALTEITPGSDGCTVCPECGSAWRCQEKSPEPA